MDTQISADHNESQCQWSGNHSEMTQKKSWLKVIAERIDNWSSHLQFDWMQWSRIIVLHCTVTHWTPIADDPHLKHVDLCMVFFSFGRFISLNMATYRQVGFDRPSKCCKGLVYQERWRCSRPNLYVCHDVYRYSALTANDAGAEMFAIEVLTPPDVPLFRLRVLFCFQRMVLSPRLHSISIAFNQGFPFVLWVYRSLVR